MAPGKRTTSGGRGAGNTGRGPKAPGGPGARGGKKKAAAAAPAEVVEAELVDGPPRPDGEGGVEAADAEPVDVEPAEVEVAELDGVPGFPEAEDDGADAGDTPVVLLDAPEGTILKKGDRSVARRDPLQAYINEIRRYSLLTREEEHELAKQFVETQDPDLAKRLITANLRLVVKIAHEYRRAHRNLLDLVQEGNIGLMQAVRKYDPMRGVKLSSYAAWWIRAYILKFILNNWRMVKIGTTQAQRKLFFNLRKEKEKLERLGFQADHKLLAERLEVTEAEVAEMDQRLAAGDASLDAPLGSSGDEGDVRTRLDVMPDAHARPDAAVAGAEFRSLLRAKLEEFAATLKGREEVLFRQRWLTEEPRTLQEIGDEFGISRERARQLEKRMLDRLKDFLQAEFGESVDIGAMVDE